MLTVRYSTEPSCTFSRVRAKILSRVFWPSLAADVGVGWRARIWGSGLRGGGGGLRVQDFWAGIQGIGFRDLALAVSSSKMKWNFLF